jgi:hypothetical protein
LCMCVFLCLCTGRVLATSWSPARGVLPNASDLVNRSEANGFMEVRQGPNWCCSAKGKNSVNYTILEMGKKVTVKLPPCLIKHHVMKRTGRLTSRIPNLSTELKWTVTFMPRPLYRRG